MGRVAQAEAVMKGRDPMRRIVCPWCDGSGIVMDENDEPTGCVPCGGTWKSEGTGVIGVRFAEVNR